MIGVVTGRAGGGALHSLLAIASGLAAHGVQVVDRPAAWTIRWEEVCGPQDIPLLTSRRPLIPRVPLAICNSSNVAGTVGGPGAGSPTIVVHPRVDDVFTPEVGGAFADAVGFPASMDVRDVHGPGARKGRATVAELQRRFPEETFIAADGLAFPEGMAAFYARCRLLLLPTLRETYGRTIVEAASAGVPVLASDLPGPRETECAAELLPPRDIDAWEDAVRRWSAPDDRGRAEARARYEAVAQRQEDELVALVDALRRLGAV